MGIEPLCRVRFTLVGCLATGSSFFFAFFSSLAFSFPVEVANAPSSNLQLIQRAIRSAEHSIYLNIYEFSSPEVAKTLIERMQHGVHVEILEEGQPVGGFSKPSRNIEQILLDGMESGGDATAKYFMMRADKVGERRFRYNHAKYIVIDDKSLVIGSENYAPTGQPSSGKKGNRGWQVFVHEPTIAQTFRKMFNSDTELTHGDVVTMRGRTRGWAPFQVSSPWPGVNGWGSADDESNPKVGAEPFSSAAQNASPVMSPTNSLKNLVSLIQSARESIDLELMSFASRWGITAKRSPLLEAVIAAAKRGVKVRVLLNDESSFQHLEANDPNVTRGKPQNPTTVKILNDLAKKEKLDLAASIADLRAMKVTYIHNKGMLVDNDKVLISSINWNRNSVENNREAAIVLEGCAIHEYYKRIFDRDWSASVE